MLRIRRTLDELEGVSRTRFGDTAYDQLVYKVGNRLTTGYDDNGIKSITSLRRGYGYKPQDGRQWAWRDQFQQALVKQARRLPYEVPAFYVADKAINKKIFGNGVEETQGSEDRKWYNPVPLITGFAKDIAKTAALQMGGFMVPVAMGSASSQSSLNFFHNANKNIDELIGAKREVAESAFFLKGVLQGVGHDIADILGKGISLSQRSTGAMAVGWTELTRADKNPVQTLYRNRHGQVDPSVQPPLSKRDRIRGIAGTIFGGNNQPLNAHSLDNDSLLNLIPGYKAVRTAGAETKQQFKLIKDAQTILNDVTQMNSIVNGGGYLQNEGSFNALSTAIQNLQKKSNSPLIRVNDFLGKFSYGSKGGRVASSDFTKQIDRQVYKDLLKRQLIDSGVEDGSADSFVRSLKFTDNILYRDLRDPDNLSFVNPVNRFGLDSDPIHEDDFFNAIIQKYNSSKHGQQKPLAIGGDALQQSISKADEAFMAPSAIEARSQMAKKHWNSVYNTYTSTQAETTFKAPKLLSSNYSASVVDASRAMQLRNAAAEVLGVPRSNQEAVANALRQVGIRDNNVDDLTRFLTQNKKMTRGSSSGLLGFLGIEKTSLSQQFNREIDTLSTIARRKYTPYSPTGDADKVSLLPMDVLADRGYVSSFIRKSTGENAYSEKYSNLRGFIDKLDSPDATIAGYYSYGDKGQFTLNVNPLKQYARKVIDFATNEIKTPVVNFNPLRLFAAKDLMEMRNAGDFQLIPGLTQNPFIRKETADADLIAWFRTGGILGSKGKVEVYGGSAQAGKILSGRYVPISTTSDSMVSRNAEFAAGEGKVKPIHDTSTTTGRIKTLLNYDREQSNSIFRFAGRFLSRKSDVNNEAVIARIIADDVDQDFVVGGFGRRRALRLTKQSGQTDDLAPISRYSLVDASDTSKIVASHEELMEAFTNFANTTLEQGTGRKVVSELYGANGPLSAALNRNIRTLNPQSVPTLTRAQSVKSITRDIRDNLDEMRGSAVSEEEILNYEIRSKAFSRLLEFEKLDDIELSAQSKLFDKSPSILTKMDEFQSELSRYLTIDEALMTGDPAQLVARMSQLVDEMASSGRLTSSEKAEAQASILSTVFNLSAFKTYKHQADFTDLSGSIQTNFATRFEQAKTILTASPESRALLDPYAQGTIASPRVSKFGPVSRLAPFFKKNLGSGKYQFENKLSSLSGDNDYTFAPTFATAMGRNPKATMLSAAGVQTYGNEEGFSLGSVPLSHGFERLNKYFGTFGAQLNVNSYSGPLSLYGAGMAGQRVLPAVAIGSTAFAIDRTAGGIVNERDERGERVYTPLVATGAARVAVEAQALMSGITPGGMDYSQKKQQLLEGEVAIRKGRFWLLGSTPFEGGKIQYFRPSWYRRLEGAATFTSDTYGSPTEKLMYYNDFSPLRPLDPYRFERKHYNDRPYPLTGEYFSGPFGPVTPLLNATVGRVLKPQKVMHKEEVDAALASSVAVGEGGAYLPVQEKRYVGSNMQANPLVSYPAAPPSNIPKTPFRHYPAGINVGSDDDKLRISSFNASYAANAGATQSAAGRVQRQIGNLNQQISLSSGGPRVGAGPTAFGETQGSYGVPAGPMIMPSRIVAAGTPIRSSSNQYISGDLGYRLQETAGIYGFLGGNVRSAITGGAYDFEPNRAVLQSASKAYGSTRAFWDLNLGGMGDVPLPAEGALGNIEISEVIRRFIPKERTNVDFLNPIKNTMGRQYPFMPGNENFIDFTRGDPYTKVPEGELRLPGVGYERFNKIYPDESGRYGAVNQFDILADVAPYSKEFRSLNKRINSMNLSEEERQKVSQIRAQQEAIERSKTNFSSYDTRSLTDKVTSPFETAKEAFLHTDNVVNNKFIGKRTATEDWERKHVYGTTFPEWQRPIESYIEPIFNKGTQRNPLLAAAIGGAVFSTMVSGRQAKVGAALIGGAATGLFSLSKKFGSERFIPDERKKEIALEEYADVLNYVKYTSAASRAQKEGDVQAAKQYMAMSKKTMYGVDLDNQNIDQVAAAIPKRKRDHFKAMLEAPQQERSRILSTAGRLERRIYEAAWGMKVEKRPDLVDYFKTRELPSADWEGWHPNTNMEHVKIKIGQSMGLELSQMGYYPQQIKEANLVNPSYPNFGAGRVEASSKDVRSRLQQLMNDNNINGQIVPIAGSSNPGSVNISAGIR
jgi:hypothetical protein